jgi:hypothetical protein
MKLEIIETPDYILAVSDKINVNDTVIDVETCTIFKVVEQKLTGIIRSNTDTFVEDACKKVIGYQPKNNAAELDLPLLPEPVVEDEVEKLFIPYYFEKFNVPYFPSDLKKTCNWWFKAGYKAATKVYSEEDLSGYFSFIEDNYHYHSDTWHDADTDEPVKRKDILLAYTQSLKQSKTPKWFVAEIEEWLDQTYSEHGCYRQKLKTTTINNKTYLVGTYLYE